MVLASAESCYYCQQSDCLALHQVRLLIHRLPAVGLEGVGGLSARACEWQPAGPTPYRYLNSGGLMGRASAILSLIGDLEVSSGRRWVDPKAVPPLLLLVLLPPFWCRCCAAGGWIPAGPSSDGHGAPAIAPLLQAELGVQLTCRVPLPPPYRDINDQTLIARHYATNKAGGGSSTLSQSAQMGE